jgi:hypothetical protein
MGTVSHKGRDERLELRNSNCPFLHTVDTVGNPGQAGNPYIGMRPRRPKTPLDYISWFGQNRAEGYHVPDRNFDRVNLRASVFIAKEADCGISVISNGRCKGISGIPIIPLLSVRRSGRSSNGQDRRVRKGYPRRLLRAADANETRYAPAHSGSVE